MRYQHFGLIVLVGLLVQCEDRQAPEIEVISPKDGAILRRDVIVELSAQDNENLEKVEIYIDDILLQELTGPPWKGTWRTREFENGAHILKAKATDTNQNESYSEEVAVQIENSLITGIFSNDWICNSCERGVLFASASDGTILGEASWSGNDTARIIPIYTTRTDTGRINITTLRQDGTGKILVTTYLDIPSGERFKYKGLPNRYLDGFDYMRFNLTNIPAHNGWSISNGYADSWVYPGSIGATATVRNYVDEVAVYLQLSNTSIGTQYLWLENQVSGTISLDLAAMSVANNRVIQFPPGGNQARSILTGYRESQSFYSAAYLLDRQRIFNASNNTMTVHPPPGLMEDYKTYMYYFEAGGWVYNTVYGEIPESFNRTSADLNILSSDKDAFEINTSGEFDQIKTLWRHTISGGSVDWNVHGPPALMAYALPVLSPLAQQYFPEVHRDQVTLVQADLIDYTELNSYQDAWETRFITEGYFNEYVKETRTRSKTVSANR